MRNRQNPRRRRKRSLTFRITKWFLIVGTLLSFAAAVALIFEKRQEQKQILAPTANSTTASPTKSTSGNLPTTRPSAASAKRGQPNVTTNSAVDVWTTAILANKNLSLAMMYPKSEENLQRQVVKQYVVPGRVNLQMKVEQLGGNVWAFLWDYGYGNVAAAQASSMYDVETKKFRIDRITPTHATVSLYTYSYFRTPTDLYKGKFHTWPSLVVIQLQRLKGTWMYVRASSPSLSNVPKFEKGKNYDLSAVDAAYQPYLKGFQDYAGNP